MKKLIIYLEKLNAKCDAKSKKKTSRRLKYWKLVRIIVELDVFSSDRHFSSSTREKRLWTGARLPTRSKLFLNSCHFWLCRFRATAFGFNGYSHYASHEYTDFLTPLWMGIAEKQQNRRVDHSILYIHSVQHIQSYNL